MADENTRRSYRANEPYGRAVEMPAGGKPDPLAELARLIGKADPFTDLGQDNPRHAEPPRAPVHDWRKTVAAMPPFENLQPEPEPQVARGYGMLNSGQHRSDPVHDRDLPYSSPLDRPVGAHPSEDQRYADYYADESQRASSGHFQTHADDRHPDDRRDDNRYDDRRYDDGRLDNARHDNGRHDNERYADAPHNSDRFDEPKQLSSGGPYYAEGTAVGPRDGAMYDDPPRSRGRNGLITAATLVACAVVGTAGAYGYRTYVGTAGTRVPPVITAEATPSKVLASIDSQPSKSIQDRLGEPVLNERLVSREEQPTEFRNNSTPRAVLPSPYAPSQPGQTGTTTPQRGGQQQANVPPSGVIGEPKSIRTIPIRPDGTDMSGRPVTGATPPGAQARPPAGPKSTPAGRNGPISLDPQAQAGGVPPAPAARERDTISGTTAAIPSQQRLASASTTVAPPVTSAPSGSIMVQLSSQKSEGEAQASFRSMQAKYPDQLGGRSPVVRRADLGEKGTFYRAMVGPFASSDEAGRFCSSLKAAGGQCIIQRN